MKKFTLSIVLSVIILLLNACSNVPRQSADIIIDNAHGGGSSVSINQNLKLLASSGWSGSIKLWHLDSGKLVNAWKAHTGDATAVIFVNDNTLVSAGYDKKLILWTINGQKIRSITSDSPITALAVDPNQHIILTGHKNGTVKQWALKDLTLQSQNLLHNGRVKSVAISPVDTNYASSGSDSQVKIWKDIKHPTILKSPNQDAYSITFSPRNGDLYGSGWFKLFHWNLAKNTLDILKTEHEGIIKAIRFSETGDHLATISRQTDSSVLWLDPDTGNTIRRFQKHDLCGSAIAIAPDYIATTSDDASVRIWHIKKQVTEK